jgi:DNA polymerase-3 subunit epsilon
MTGYAVIDFETTGLSPAYNHRIVEVGIVQLTARGDEEQSWTTLVNPQRDLGATDIHGISARDVFNAPTFEDIAGKIVQLVAGRVPVAHNLPFDAGFLSAEFARIGFPEVVAPDRGLCTMRLAGNYLACSRRSLDACCDSIGHPIGQAHSALDDARASGRLLAHFLSIDPHFESHWKDCISGARTIPWPQLPSCDARCVVRTTAPVAGPESFLSRLVSRAPTEDIGASAGSYLARIDRVLMDRNIYRHEEAELVAAAGMLGLSREEVIICHRRYLSGLAAVANSDGIVTPEEEADLLSVARLLGLPDHAVSDALEAAVSPAEHVPLPGAFTLAPGAKIAFTGEAQGFNREEMEAQAEALGLRVMTSVSKKTALVVAADPDSLSGKARKARELSIPMVDFPCYLSMIAKMR